MKGLLKNNIFMFFFSLSIYSGPLEAITSHSSLGVAVEPMNISVQSNKVAYFKLYNETDLDYIVITKVILSEQNKINQSDALPFTVTSPIGYIKNRSNIQMGVIYLSDKGIDNNRYYLSVSFIPKKKSSESSISAPIVLEHQIPISVLKN
ncbi:fimbria/pilus periplasmic chaperone [Yersinia enterocolitica]|uniref:fimbria/pilus periplasmic chaperone n=1 Tax=Yersinia enterocolitica TaxID=630 RepID=UPI001C60E3DA|nr:fimbria/pilus periplasmic chaperone [Yersinia enterocolitica]MBW5879267.1 fimbria/pilus periplasmic chaperone [Yersinia enterocolitica]